MHNLYSVVLRIVPRSSAKNEMRITVIGAGAIGGLVAGYLKLKDQDVTLIGHAHSAKVIKEKELQISGIRGDFHIQIDAFERLAYEPDLVILSTKTQDIEASIKDNLKFIKDKTILTTQNGIQADNIVARYIPKENIISSIVMYGSTNLEPGKVVHNFEGNWIIGKIFTENDETVIKIHNILQEAFTTIISEEIKGMKYLKIFINANNCLAAILGVSMQEAFSDLEISRISIAIWKEGLDIVSGAGINLVSLPDFPLERLMKLTSMPTSEAAKIYSGIMRALSKEPLYGSILQSIKRKRNSEIDYINGEFVNIARQNNLAAPLNEKLVKMVHRIEDTKKFFTKAELINATKEFVN